MSRQNSVISNGGDNGMLMVFVLEELIMISSVHKRC